MIYPTITTSQFQHFHHVKTHLGIIDLLINNSFAAFTLWVKVVITHYRGEGGL